MHQDFVFFKTNFASSDYRAHNNSKISESKIKELFIYRKVYFTKILIRQFLKYARTVHKCVKKKNSVGYNI